MSTKSSVDVLIVGGGITGAGIFRDLSLQGVDCFLIDQLDFASQTSSYSSKMFHGGLRYLETLDFSLIWEALHEKNLWLKMAPYLCYEQEFVLPIYKKSKYSLFLTSIALFMYDLLSGLKNKPYKIIGVDQTLKLIPSLKKDGLKGAGIYHDAIVNDTRMALDNIFSALQNNNAKAKNYTELIDIIPQDNGYAITLFDKIKKQKYSLDVKEIIFATGPFTDQLLSKFTFLKWKEALLPSKGSHLWIRRDSLNIKNPMLLTTKDNRIIFVIPHSNAILVGTTEVDVPKNYIDTNASVKEVDYLLSVVNEFFDTKISESQIISTYSGIRPLAKGQFSFSKKNTSRKHIEKEIYPNIHAVFGGKLTTFRVMGQKTVRKICHKRSMLYNKTKTLRPLEYVSKIPYDIKFHDLLTFETLLHVIKEEKVVAFEDLIKRRLGLNNKKHWRTKDLSFDDFFNNFYNQYKKDLPFLIDEVNQF